jgi:uncharacterized protein YeaO (DUF488 family)
MTQPIRTKRVYEPASADDGQRILVDRLWPRGVSKDEAALTLWLKAIAPSDDLRKWFGHDPDLWLEFHRRYTAELEANPEATAELRDALRSGPATLLYAAHDAEHNNAVVLADYLRRA